MPFLAHSASLVSSSITSLLVHYTVGSLNGENFLGQNSLKLLYENLLVGTVSVLGITQMFSQQNFMFATKLSQEQCYTANIVLLVMIPIKTWCTGWYGVVYLCSALKPSLPRAGSTR